MELAGEDGSTIELKPSSSTVLGRGSGFSTADRTVSRRHVLFSLKPSNEAETEPLRACFQVIGRNPVWVRRGKSGEVKGFRRNEKGEVAVGDWLCVGCGGGGQRLVWFEVKRRSEVGEEEKGIMEAIESSELCCNELEESFDISSIDPVKEFGFLVIGHEFDQYSKEKLRDIKNWDWFLEEPRNDSDEDDEASDKGKKRGLRRKRRKVKTNDDDDEEDWTGESEEDKEVIEKVKGFPRPTYSTRSKDRDKPQKGKKNDLSSVQKKAITSKRDESKDEDEDDPTLGGFIVGEEDEEPEEESDVDQQEEEEFNDDVGDD